MSPAGLAAERTALAWRRTAIGVMVVAALFLNYAAMNGWQAATIAPVGAAAALTALAGVCYRRNRSLRDGRFEHGSRAVTATVLVIVAVACAWTAAGLIEL
ncbi:DUF202 domain-containing protein [Nocardia australiensis]|uniref:DUF202 domain-containing protein n=1 Tax=Nocardia australiensis TaxID=2887191 RepID=UPI001D152DE4|nr:DUF202 domain-containing protein [Nocardia australiensis]